LLLRFPQPARRCDLRRRARRTTPRLRLKALPPLLRWPRLQAYVRKRCRRVAKRGSCKLEACQEGNAEFNCGSDGGLDENFLSRFWGRRRKATPGGGAQCAAGMARLANASVRGESCPAFHGFMRRLKLSPPSASRFPRLVKGAIQKCPWRRGRPRGLTFRARLRRQHDRGD
jgi:hypothetical protein